MHGGTLTVSMPISLKREQLSFAMEPDKDEFVYETIFAAPVPSVVMRLKKYKTRTELWQDLPQSL